MSGIMYETKMSSLTAAHDIVLTVIAQNHLKLTLADLSRFLRRTVRAKDESGKESLFEGVSLTEILLAGGVKFGKELRGKHLADYLLVETEDRYRVVFALPELDPTFGEVNVLLADRRDGEPLEGTDGTLRLIIPSEKRYARWVRRVISLQLRSAEE